MKNVLIGVAAVLVMLVVVAFILPSHVTVYRSRKIEAPAAQVHSLVTSVHNWERWSPWHKRDPQMKITYGPITEGQGASWSWESKSEGNGKMTLTLVQPDTVTTELDFFEHGKAMSGFSFKPEGNGTVVTWSMACDMGNNPFMRYMGLCMDSMVGEDYEKGLNNLKALAEKGTASAQ